MRIRGNHITASVLPALPPAFNPEISNGQYVPEQVYTVSVSSGGGQSSMLGSTAGSWANGGCSQGNTVGVGSSEAQWTAPGSGSVTVGGTKGGNYAYGVDTIQVIFVTVMISSNT